MLFQNRTILKTALIETALSGESLYFQINPIEFTAPPMVVERAWERRPFHYDNVFMAMLTLFAVQTSEGWVA